MKTVIRAIYKNGVLKPITPVNNLRENDIVDLEISPAETPMNIVSEKEAIQMLVNMGVLIPPPHKDDIPPVSEEEREELADRLGKLPGKPLSEIIIEDRI